MLSQPHSTAGPASSSIARSLRGFPSCSRRFGARAASSVAVVAACLLVGITGFANPAFGEVLVSNINQTNFGQPSIQNGMAQQFTTGTNQNGYTLTSIEFQISETLNTPRVLLATGLPSTRGAQDNAVVAILTNPATLNPGTRTFTAPPGTTLSASTTYYVVADGLAGRVRGTASTAEEPGAHPGWSIGDRAHWSSTQHSRTWQLLTNYGLKIRVNGSPISSPDTASTPEAPRRAVKRTVAAVASRMVSSALDTLGARMGSAAPASGLSLAGLNLAGVMPVGRPAPSGLENAALSGAARFDGHGPSGGGSRGAGIDTLWRGSAFSLALGAAEGEPGFDAGALRWGVWGRGDYGSFEGRADADSRYKGETRTGWLGADAQGGRWVAGLAVSRGTSETDYTLEGEKGRVETALSALWPYGRWTFANGLELRGIAGAGSGMARHVPQGDEPRERSRLTMRAGALGLRQALAPLDGFDLAARADASFARMETAKGEEAVDGLRADSWRLRGGLEASKRFALQDGAALSPFAELAARRDGGDGPAGTGVELAGGLRYAAPGVSVEARGRWLAAHSAKGTRERGASATVRLDPDAGGRGLSLALTPRWGAHAGGAGALWREEMPQASGASDAGALDARFGYGFAPAGGGLLTPFAEAGVAGGDGSQRLRLGTRFEVRHGALALELAGERRESAGAQPEHTLRLELRLGF